MIVDIVMWYLIMALAGWLVFPLAYRMLAFLPDRGVIMLRPLGLLLWGYACWLLTSFNVLQNNTGGVLLALLFVAGFSAWIWWKSPRAEMAAWLRSKKPVILTGEILFLLAFLAWTVVRATNPDASGTEKPMELAFINATLRSPAFPPADPWLSGYAISYYYFGYMLVAMLARLAGVTGAVAFNLALSSWFALTALASFGLVYNLLALRSPRQGGQHAWALLGPLFVLVVSNLEGFLEMLHARGIFWQPDAGGDLRSPLWSWLNIQEIVNPPAQPFGWEPNRPGGIWWWRASRVLQDIDFNGGPREIIDEFPMFSYVLGDLHPHVLAMPFAMLAAVLALNSFLRYSDTRVPVFHWSRWVGRAEFWLVSLALGGMAFLNTWDMPIALALFAAALALSRYLRKGFSWDLAVDFLAVCLSTGLASILLYLPFYTGFSSQAAGFLPSLVFFTRGAHLWVMFGGLLLPVLAWLGWQWRHSRQWNALVDALLLSVGLVFGLWLLSSLFGLFLFSRDPGLAGIFGAQPSDPLVFTALLRRLAMPGAWVSLLGLIALAWGLFSVFRRSRAEMETREELSTTPYASTSDTRAEPFVLLLILVGAGLVLFPEFFYLRDQFGWRMNTIFKFYFQAWILWAVAASYASAVLWQSLRGHAAGLAFRLGWAALLLMGLAYPAFAIPARMGDVSLSTLSLDGSAHIARYTPEEMEAIRWLQKAPYGVVAEAVGGSYTGYARVSTHSGLPSVLGWPGHESQWRGGGKEMGSRNQDIVQLFRARDWEEAQTVIEKYNIRYVFVGTYERGEYRPDEALFEQNLVPVFQNGLVTIYEVPRFNLQVQLYEP